MDKAIRQPKEKQSTGKTVLTCVFCVISFIYMVPILLVIMNSMKANTSINLAPFALPNSETFMGFANYKTGMISGNYPFLQSVANSFIITALSVVLIILCTSMAAWYMSRVNDKLSKVCYYLFVFSMVVPFQMVMFTLADTARKLGLDKPLTIPIIYLGFGAGLAVFMFSGFVKSMPLEVEEAASIDGCGPIRTFFGVVLPMLKPIIASVSVLELMWVWNDYLLPYLVLDVNTYKTIPIHIQYLQGSYGHVDLGATMALIVVSIIPIVIFYLTCQKYIISGVTAGAVKG